MNIMDLNIKVDDRNTLVALQYVLRECIVNPSQEVLNDFEELELAGMEHVVLLYKQVGDLLANS